MSNFIGFALDCVDRTLLENQYRLPKLWMIGHPGKLAKILDNVWETHSGKTESAVGAIYRTAKEFGWQKTFLKKLEESKSVEVMIEILRSEKKALSFWSEIEEKIATLVSVRLKHVSQVAVRLFEMDGKALGKRT